MFDDKTAAEVHAKIQEFLPQAFDIDRLNRVFEDCRIKTHDGFLMTVKELVDMYLEWVPSIKRQDVQDLTFEQLEEFAKVIDFSDCPTMQARKTKIFKLLNAHPILRGEDMDSTIERINSIILEYSPKYLPSRDGYYLRYPFVDWIPDFGGPIDMRFSPSTHFKRWAQLYNLSYIASGRPIMSRQQEARIEVEYDRNIEGYGPENPAPESDYFQPEVPPLQ